MIRNIYIGKTTARKFRSCIKIGIAFKTEARWGDIDKSVEGSEEWPIFTGPVLFAAKFEKVLHRRYSKHRTQFRGSGKTEWFRMSVLKRVEAVLIVVFLVLATYAVLVGCGFMLLVFMFQNLK